MKREKKREKGKKRKRNIYKKLTLLTFVDAAPYLLAINMLLFIISFMCKKKKKTDNILNKTD